MRSNLLVLVLRSLIVTSMVTGLVATGRGAELLVPSQHPTITAALQAASTGDEIIVDPGTYAESFNITKVVTLRSASGSAADTILDLGGGGRVGVLASATIQGMTFMRGDVALLCQGADMVVQDCVFDANSATSSGAAIQVTGGSPEITRCVFTNNTSTTGGGAVAFFNGSGGTVRACSFRGNQAQGAAAVFLLDSSPWIVDCDFSGHETMTESGAMNLHGSHARITRCVFTDNSAFEGGALNIGRQSSPIVEACRFDNNRAQQGGAVNVEDAGSSATFVNCKFVHNQAFTDSSGLGGAMFVWAGPVVEVVHGTFANNVATQGGAIYNQASGLVLTNSVLASSVPDSLRNVSGGSAIATHCNIVGGLPNGTQDGGGNINADPLFVDVLQKDYRLRLGSPCIDAGTPALVAAPSDDEGDPRDVDGDSNGTNIVDIGADEFAFLWSVNGTPMFGGTLSFTTMHPTSLAGARGYVAISRGDGGASGGIVRNGCPRPIGLDDDATLARWRQLPPATFRVPLDTTGSGTTSPVSIPNLPSMGGLRIYYAGAVLGGGARGVSPTRSFVLP